MLLHGRQLTTSSPAPGPSYNVPPQEPGEGNWEGVNILYETQNFHRMVIRNGNVQLVVSDVSAAIDNISGLAGEMGGYVVSSQKWKEGERNLGKITIRVLAEKYDQAMVALRGLAISVISESTSTQDVTEEYVDLGSRVKNLEATEAQLLKVMETAATTEKYFKIQRELTTVQGEIEQIRGRMQYLERMFLLCPV